MHYFYALHSPETYMRRCLELASLGAGHVAPNPMVGAVLVFEDRIIGEGYHRQYGGPHAEPECIDSVPEADRGLIGRSTLYVSLEPCAHHGKTPPCADLIIRTGIPKVVIGCRDPFPEVNGKGIDRLRAAGVEVETGVLERECIGLNKRFFTFHLHHRPYIVLKWAQTASGLIAGDGARWHISNEITNRLVHKWRSEEASILVGPRTALLDDPELTVRLWTGPDPVRLVIDKELQLPFSLKLFDGKVRTIVFNNLQHGQDGHLEYYQLATDTSLIHQLVTALHRLKLQSVLVEGGARLLQSFIEEDYWDEARVITGEELEPPAGLPAPRLLHMRRIGKETILSDTIRYYEHDSRG
ncbi:MAG TPA: bifunctional diaminohydroxyphosphoribosylaminopyrimidine deaminase/5-amino-6-(5-phosphoribosylamino)uracil reductase RibD [Puia sp.]|nr:bifunctional diaminohydroxyphosphoribosylaminopyrimidine deaminase/5-amino-6-(5-phosphoribosylamino)uracil reductase RibD [Puia sp.]